MRKQFALILCSLLLVGCSTNTETTAKVDDTLLNHFSKSEQRVIEEVNPDVITMQYLVNHAEDYATSLDTDRNDFFVIVHGTVTKLETVEYDDAILEQMDADTADLLRGKTSVNFYLDNCSTAMIDSDSKYNLKTDKEYYFYVKVSESATGYRYIPFKCFNFN